MNLCASDHDHFAGTANNIAQIYVTAHLKFAAMDDLDLKCGICLELFQDPRSLPCLHTFCRECIQRSLNEENHSLKCPVCRAKHELSEGAGLLPVNQYALQELPLKRLQQQREDNGGPHQLVECKSCGEQAGPVVAWCEDCDGVICQPCGGQHEKLVGLRNHHVVKNDDSRSPNVPARNKSKFSMASCCTRHVRVELKYWCTLCSEVVCAECLLGAHKDHDYSLAEEAHHNLETKIKEMVGLVLEKKQEFSEYLEKAHVVEGKALEYSERMKSEVNNVFDGIVASVEAQRNEALQSVSQGVKEIWSQKEMMEVSLAQLDSFTKFAENTHKCMTDVAMAAQSVKLMERLKDIHGDENALDEEKIKSHALESHCSKDHLNIRLHTVFGLGQPLTFKFSPAPGTQLSMSALLNKVNFNVSLEVGGIRFPELLPPRVFEFKLNVTALYNNSATSAQVESGPTSWTVIVKVSGNKFYPLAITCKLLLGAAILESTVSYTA